MNTTIEEKGELISIAQITTANLFDGSSMDTMLAQIEAKARAYDLDISTPAGRKEIASVAYKIAQSKTAIDAAGKKLVEGIKAEAKIIDDERKKARDFLDGLKNSIRQPLTDFENAEKERVAALESRLARIESVCLDIPEDSAQIKNLLIRLSETDAKTFEEFAKRAAGLIAVAKDRLTEKLAIVEKREAEAAELLRLRAEAAERDRIDREARIAAEAAEKARIDAEQKAAKEKAESEAAHQRAIEAERKAAEDRERKIREEAETKEREAQAKAEAERKAAEVAAEAEAKRVANKRHREKIISEIVADLCFGGVISPDVARQVADAMAAGDIRHVTIQF
jgi:colicin import membrane protein